MCAHMCTPVYTPRSLCLTVHLCGLMHLHTAINCRVALWGFLMQHKECFCSQTPRLCYIILTPRLNRETVSIYKHAKRQINIIDKHVSMRRDVDSTASAIQAARPRSARVLDHKNTDINQLRNNSQSELEPCSISRRPAHTRSRRLQRAPQFN